MISTDRQTNPVTGFAGYASDGKDDTAAYQWTLEDAGDVQRLKNVSIGKYLALKKDTTQTELSDAPATDPATCWILDVGENRWQSVQNVANMLYLTLEHKTSFAECDAKAQPGGKDWWSGQWRLVDHRS